MDNCGDLAGLCGQRLLVVVKRREGEGVNAFVVHIFSLLINMLHKVKHRCEQGLLLLYTEKLSGYYDYLYIHISRCETNLSLNWGRS